MSSVGLSYSPFTWNMASLLMRWMAWVPCELDAIRKGGLVVCFASLFNALGGVFLFPSGCPFAFPLSEAAVDVACLFSVGTRFCRVQTAGESNCFCVGFSFIGFSRDEALSFSFTLFCYQRLSLIGWRMRRKRVFTG